MEPPTLPQRPEKSAFSFVLAELAVVNFSWQSKFIKDDFFVYILFSCGQGSWGILGWC